MCSTECSNNPNNFHQKEECTVLSRDIKNIGVPYQNGETPRYDIILVLRCVLLFYTNFKSWSQLYKMESHWQKRKEEADPYHMATVRYLTEVCKMDVDPDVIHHVRGAIITNCYETKTASGDSIRGVYPLMGRVNHSCVQNVCMTSNEKGEMTLRASSDLSADTPLYVSYIGTSEPIWERINYTKKMHYFNCQCDRCADSTEFGTYYSNPKCQKCKTLMHCKSLNNDNLVWDCSKCHMLKNQSDLNKEILNWQLLINDFDNKSLQDITDLLKKIENDFHKQHFLYVKAAQKAIKLMEKDYSIEALTLKERLWKLILEITHKFDPGQCRKRGMLSC